LSHINDKETEAHLEDALQEMETVIREPHRRKLFKETPPSPAPALDLNSNLPSYISNEPEQLDYTLMPLDTLEEVTRALMYDRDTNGEFVWASNPRHFREILARVQSHIYAFSRGEDIDPSSGQSHIACAIIDLMFLQSHLIQGAGHLDNRFKR
jgi:hypothetical protein